MKLISANGPAHNKTFTSVAIIKGVKYCSGTGKTKKESEQVASRATLEILFNLLYFQNHQYLRGIIIYIIN